MTALHAGIAQAGYRSLVRLSLSVGGGEWQSVKHSVSVLNPAMLAPCEDLLSGSTLRPKCQPSTDECEMLSSDTRQGNDSSHFDLLLQCIVVVCRVGLSVGILMGEEKGTQSLA